MELQHADHGYIVESAAERRLQVASKSFDGPVWLIRKTADQDNQPHLVLCCCQSTSAPVTHHALVSGDSGAIGLHGKRMYPNLNDLVLAYQDFQLVGAPAPIGDLIPRDSKNLWSSEKQPEEVGVSDTSQSTAANNASNFCCGLCSFVDSAQGVFMDHVAHAHTDVEKREWRSHSTTASQVLPRWGVFVHLERARGFQATFGNASLSSALLSSSSSSSSVSRLGLFVRFLFRDRRLCQSTVVFGSNEPVWDQQVFVPASDGGGVDDVMPPLSIEVWRRAINGIDALYASQEFPLDDLQPEERKRVTLDFKSRIHMANDPISVDLEFKFGREPIVTEQQQQDGGVLRSLTSRFRTLKMDSKRKQFDSASFQLSSRLSQLLFEGPSGKARKAYEKSLVEWVKDSLAPKCPDCGEKFGMMRGRHHCRLCGGVVCHACSQTLDIDEAVSLVKETFSARGQTLRKTEVINDQGDIRACQNCCRTCESVHQSAMLFQRRRMQMQESRESMRTAETYFDVLREGAKKLRTDLIEFNALATRIGRCEALNQYERSVGLQQAIEEALIIQSKLTMKLIACADGRSGKVFENVYVATVGLVQDIVLNMESLPPRETVLALISQRNKLQQEATTFLGRDHFDVMETQRRHERVWFSANALLDRDWPAWSSEDGSWGYHSRSLINPNPGFGWAGSWQLDFELGDEDGWVYATDFHNNLDAWDSSFNALCHNVRRRRWYRFVRTLSVSSAKETLVGNGETFETDTIGGSRGRTRSNVKLKTRSGSSASVDNNNNSNDNNNNNNNNENNHDDDDNDGDASDLQSSPHSSPSLNTKRSTWIANNAAPSCMLCQKNFTKIRRRHHCRHCGRVVCDKCSREKTLHGEFQKKKDVKKGVRTCDQCVQFQSRSQTEPDVSC